MTATISTTLAFEPSPSINPQSASAGYIVRQLIDGQLEPDRRLQAGRTTFDVTAPEGSLVQVFVYPVDEQDRVGLAREFRFRVTRDRLPDPVGLISISDVRLSKLSLDQAG